MKIFHTLLSAVALSLMGMVGNDASAKVGANVLRHDVNVPNLMRRMAPNAGIFESNRSVKAAEINSMITSKVTPLFDAPNYITPTPDVTVGPTRSFRDMDGPDGQLWYYTSKLVSRPIQHEYYTEYILEEYTFDIFDANMDYVGTIHDKMRYQDDEVRVPGPDLGIDVLPVVTKNFFNSDDLCEIVVSIAVNTTTPGKNNYRSVVYSLNGEKEILPVYNASTKTYEDKECDKIVNVFNSFVGDVLSLSTAGHEEVYMTFMNEILPEGYFYSANAESGSEEETPVDTSFWDAMCRYKYHYQMYGKVGQDGKLQHVMDVTIPIIQSQGDQESTPPVMTLEHNGCGYLVHPYYEDTFFNPYYDPYDDMSMRENNNLVIDLYKIQNYAVEKVSTTKIPVVKDNKNGVLATYYSVGDLRYTKDVDFVNFGNNDKPVYYITRCNYVISTDGKDDYCYYAYDVDGNKVCTVFEYADANIELTQANGLQPEHMFVDIDDDGDYRYNMVNLVTGNDPQKTVKISSLLKLDPDDDGDLIMANVDRVPFADGSYKYAFEMRVPGVDDDENDIMRVVWFDADGKYDRMDGINMGKNVYFAQTYINGTVLNPDLFTDQDDEHEYMVLIKRGIDPSGSSSASQEELIVAQPVSEANPEGKTFLHLTPCEKGVLSTVGISQTKGVNSLNVSYASDGADNSTQYYTDFYYLPFKLDAIQEITEAVAAGNISFDGSVIAAEGSIEIFNLKGIAVAAAINEVNVASLPSGIYVAVSGGKAYKFSK